MGLWWTMTARRTWWHLEDTKRKPSDYEIATSKLLYYPTRGFEVRTPAGNWLSERQRSCPLRVNDWENFRDPREMTYTKYTTQQNAKQIFTATLLRSADETASDQRLSAEWVATLDRVLCPLLYPVHGFQMVSAYLGQMAESGRIVVPCALQAADEMRRIQCIADRIRQLQTGHPDIGRSGKAHWQERPEWQPLRRAIELLLVSYDFGEAFTALNLVLKPSFDALFLVELARLAERSADEVSAKVLGSLDEDARWHREWTSALSDFCIRERAENAAVLNAWIDKWRPLADAAIEPFSPLFGGDGAEVLARVRETREAGSLTIERSAS